MSVENAVKAYAGLKKIADQKATVHLTGGEPFLVYDRLIKILKAYKKENLGPIDQLETNGYWAENEEIIIEKLKQLDDLGIEKLKISCDHFHQEFVAIENVKRLAKVTENIWSKNRLLVRWYKYLDNPVDMKKLSQIEKTEKYLQSIKEFPCRFTGRAADTLASKAPQKPLDKIKRYNCRKSFFASKGIHIDPFGNIFSGTCSGITLGNITNNNLEDIWKSFDPSTFPVISTLIEKGPAGLLDLKETQQYTPKTHYAGKCQLCTEIRNHLRKKNKFPDIITPDQCYL